MARPIFTERAVAKAVAGAIKGGMTVGRVEIDREGRISVVAASGGPKSDGYEGSLEQWLAQQEIEAWLKENEPDPAFEALLAKPSGRSSVTPRRGRRSKA